MKKFISFFLVVVFLFSFALSASAYTVGMLSKLDITENDWKNSILKYLKYHSEADDYVFVFYDSILSMTLSLGAGDIDAMALPEIVAHYVINNRPDLKVSRIIKPEYKQYFVFGFSEKNEELCKKFNDALKDIKSDGTLDKLKERYLKTDGEIESISFENFADAETIKVAVTGDLPPIDYVASDGSAAGFNTALLSEIAKKLKVNISLVNTNTGARAASLISGRSDVAFWYQLSDGVDKQKDIPQGIIVSEPYYEWDKYVDIMLKNENKK